VKKLLVLATLLFSFVTPAALAFDTPLLTWERGRDQQVVLGGGEDTSNWQVQLEGNGITPITFEKSSKNNAGYVVYSASIPSDIPTGAYTVVTVGTGSPRTAVAVVAMVQASTKTATSSLFDLTRIIAIFAFLTTLLGALRLDKYSRLNFRSTQLDFFNQPVVPKNALEKLQGAPLSARLKILSDLKPSLLKYLLLQEGEYFFSKSRLAYSILPVAGILLGAIAAIEIMRNEGIVKTGLGIFIAVTLLAIIDPIAGFAAVVAFVSAELVAGNVFSVRDLLLIGAISFTWMAPALFAALVRQVAPLDIPKLSPDTSGAKVVASLIAAVVGTIAFYFGFLLISSILYVESTFQELTLFQAGIVFAALLIRSMLGFRWESATSETESSQNEFFVARINSPMTALVVNFLIFAFVYIWTQSAQKSLIVSALFALPYYLVFIGMGSSRINGLSRIPRNFFIEAIAVAAICWLIFRQVSGQPLLSDDAGFWLLFLTSIPLIAHAQLTAIWPNSIRKETISL
jgi:hypothetical protein